MRFYIEEVAVSRHSMNGKHFSGYPLYQEIQDCRGRLIPVEGELKMITHKQVFWTQSRTVSTTGPS
ncbi:MAG: hypothetical protein M1598_08185 [Actinobacteria bacterium]|nr:hypothetical protein [Actinomycetota bacterium]